MPAIPTAGSDPSKGAGDWLNEECDAIFVVEHYQEGGLDGEGRPTEDFHCLITYLYQFPFGWYSQDFLWSHVFHCP